ncbi:MAG: efflux RND transporter periplasmic adaptor subunit [Sterolibacterium sp.]
MKQSRLWLIGVMLAGLAGGWFIWDRQHVQPAEAPSSPGKQAGVSVTTTLAQRQTQPIVLTASGYVVSLNSVEIHPQVSNIISRVHVKEGQFVKAGELLFTLDERTAQASLLKAEAQLAKDQSTLISLERQFARQKELRQQGFIAQNALDIVKGQYDAQLATVRQDQAALEGERVGLSFNTLRAPISGRVGAINVYPGSLVQPSSSTLVTITQLDPITVSFTLPEREVASLLTGAKTGNVSIEAFLPNSNWKRAGRLHFIDNAVDSQSGTIRVKGLFANADSSLWPGAYAGIRISVRELKDAVLIPLAAVVNAVDGTHVYTVSADATVQRRKIEILHGFDTRAAIRGLEGGERVVVDGTQNLRPGMKVREAGSDPNKPATESKPAGS